MKKLSRLAICLLAAMFLLTACGSNTAASSATTTATASGSTVEATETASAGTPVDPNQPSWKSDNSPFTVNWYADLSWWKWNGGNWGADLTSSIIKEKTGATVKFTIPAADDGQQLATMIASDSLPDVITIEGWWKPQNRSLTNKMAIEGVNPEMWRNILKPRLRTVIDAAKAVNPDILIFYHGCGNLQKIIPDLIEIGVDILNPLQPECMNPLEIKEKFGDRLSFWGTVGTQTTMPFGNAEEVGKVCRQMMEQAGRDGGLLLAPTHVLEPEVPWSNIEAFVETVKAYNK